jgi:hypothetical protein
VIDGDDPKVTGVPDSTLLNRGEGYEMLYFINTFIERNVKKPVKNIITLGRQIEYMIIKVIDTDIRSQQKIELHLIKNWDNLYPAVALIIN